MLLAIGLLYFLVNTHLASYSNLHEVMNEEELKHYFGTSDTSDLQDTYDVALLRKVKDDNLLTRYLKNEADSVEDYVFEAFGKEVSLKMRKNNLLVSPRANIVHIDSDGKSVRRNVNQSKSNCHLLHKTGSLVAAVSNCKDGNLMGFISTDKDTFEIAPLTDRLKKIAKPANFFRKGSMPEISEGMLINDLYLVKRATFPNFIEDSEEIKEIDDEDDDDEVFILDVEFPIEETNLEEEAENNIIEMAVFLDQVGYQRLSQLYSDEETEAVLLAYINQVAALYHIPSLGQQIDITITYLEIMKHQNFDSHEGDKNKLLESFCDYSNRLNPKDDLSDPRHWDIGILVTGLDLWIEKNGVRNDDTLGLARTRGMCHHKFSCAVVELGVVGAIGTLYPTTGFSAAYILAHEVGHTLGMKHDGIEDGCDWSGFIMSRSRGKHGQTKWSPCSQDKLRSYQATGKLKCLKDRPSTTSMWDHNQTHGVPGYFFTADEQCRFFFKGLEGSGAAEQDETICQSLECSDGRDVVETGPPLEGTSCGGEGTHWCRAGLCVPVQGVRWGGWRQGHCQSACVKHSMGVRLHTRDCLVLPGHQAEDQCQGDHQYLSLCDDVAICGTRSCGSGRKTRVEIATKVCEQLSQETEDVKRSYVMGSPAKHNDNKPEQACAIYCNKSGGEGWFRPRNTFFPDGTWCHHHNTLGDFFCRNHQCQPSNSTLF